jgi:CRISPR-associated protein Cas1
VATLYLTEQRSIVKKDGDTLVVHIPANKEKGTEKRKVRVPLIKVDQVVVQGDSTLTTPALLALLEQRADVCFCAYHGQFRGRLTPGFSKNSLIRLDQHRWHNDPEHSLDLARLFVQGKLANQRTLLMRTNRKRQDPSVARSAADIKGVLDRVSHVRRAEDEVIDPRVPQAGTAWGTLLGLEGAAAAFYFDAFQRLLHQDLGFTSRKKRPPTDPVNALLSYGYTLLMNKVASAVQLVGLDPYVGFLHSSQYGKPALALDLMEEFRSVIVDSVVLTLVNNRILQAGDFREEFGVFWLEDGARKTFLTKFEERLNTEIKHPTFDYKATYRKCLELQVRLLAKSLTSEVPKYRPFVVR